MRRIAIIALMNRTRSHDNQSVVAIPDALQTPDYHAHVPPDNTMPPLGVYAHFTRHNEGRHAPLQVAATNDIIRVHLSSRRGGNKVAIPIDTLDAIIPALLADDPAPSTAELIDETAAKFSAIKRRIRITKKS